MSKKGGNFFEEHIEKVVLGIVGAVCLWLFVSRVVFSPNVVEYQNASLSASRVDEQIKKQAEVLEGKINQSPKTQATYKPRMGDFTAKFSSAIENIDSNLHLPLPSSVYIQQVMSNRTYTVPKVGQIKAVEAEHVRTVAFVPTKSINEENPYLNSEAEANDIDMVTVQAKLDVAGLYERFYSNFAGENVRNEQWCDPCLAIPVFAAVQLQRQEMLADGNWNQWQIVPRTRIDSHRKMLDVEEDVRKLPAGGVRIRLLQFNDPLLRKAILQPDGYKIASFGEEWYPPSLHREFLKNQQNLKVQEKHDAKVAASKEEAERAGSRSERRKGVDARFRGSKSSEEGSGGGVNIISSGASKKPGAQKNRAERASEKEIAEKAKESAKAPTDIPTRFSAILLGPATELSRMSTPLEFWAIDDMVQPGKTYRYRIRFGVFNPIAGTDQFCEEDKHMQNNVILWSDFSDVTKNVEIPAILYFFPREIQEVSRTATVQVSRYVFGNWYSKDFVVKRGEEIGKVARTEVTEEKSNVVVPETINYDTGAVVVDIVPVNDWSGSKGFHSRNYFDMLYSFDGTAIEHMPIKIKNWDEKVQARFNEIKKAEKEPKVSLRDWSGPMSQAAQQQRRSTKPQSMGD